MQRNAAQCGGIVVVDFVGTKSRPECFVVRNAAYFNCC